MKKRLDFLGIRQDIIKAGTSLLFFLCFAFTASAQQNIAPLATVTADGSALNNNSSGGCKGAPCSSFNNLVIDTCEAQEVYLQTTNPPTTIEGWDYIEWAFPKAQYFDTLVIHHAYTANRFLTGATVQFWDAYTNKWISHSSFSNLPQQCVNRIGIPPLLASRFRITLFEMTGSGQTSNPSFREIEILETARGVNDMGVTKIDSLNYLCAGNQNVDVTIQNYGLNQIDSLNVFWEVDGVLQSPIQHLGLIDTINGNNPSEVTVSLGSHNFQTPTTLKVYTDLPNGQIDTINMNDTLELLVKPAMSGNYTVDTTMAASATNFTDITSMTAALNKHGVCGPTKINISNGTYNEPLYLKDIPGASSVNNITIDGNDSSQTIITQNGAFAALTFEGSKNVHVKNITFKMTGTSGNAVVFAANAMHDTLSSCVSWVDPTATSTAAKNILFTAYAPLDMAGAAGSYNVLQNNYIVGGYYGIKAEGTASEINSYNQFYNNIIDSTYDYGAYFHYQDSLAFIGNSINMLGRANSNAKGVDVYHSNNTHFKQNYIWAINYAANLNNINANTFISRHYEVSNNMLYSQNSYGLRIDYLNSVDVWHNSINVTSLTEPAVY